MHLVRRGWPAVTLAVAAVLLIASPAAADPGTPPSSMASLGDSITRGFNACGWFVDCTSRSFSTGDNSTVYSHYLRIRAANPAIGGRNFNDARSGAKAVDLPDQARQAVGQGVQYVTMLIGANDACTSSEATMTPVAAYRVSVRTALTTLKSGLPGVRVVLISVPDIQHLWAIGKNNLSALTVWSLFHVCQSMLANPISNSSADNARRDRVHLRVMAYNTELANACAWYGPNCAYDNGAVFRYRFTLSQVSSWDYFHPNTGGQAALAELSYAAGFNWH